MKLFKILFINPAINKEINKLYVERNKIVNSINPKMSQQQKANLYCKESEYEFAIKTLKSML